MSGRGAGGFPLPPLSPTRRSGARGLLEAWGYRGPLPSAPWAPRAPRRSTSDLACPQEVGCPWLACRWDLRLVPHLAQLLHFDLACHLP